MKHSLQRLQSATLLILLTGVLVITSVSLARAQVPTLPQALYGEVVAAGQPAPAGSVIEARGTGVKTGIPLNPLVTGEAGKYGGSGAFDLKLLVQGTVTDGTPVEFYVNGVKAQVAEAGGEWRSSYPFQSNTVVLLNLRVQTVLPAAPLTTPIPTSTPAPPTATLPPPQTAVPTATKLPREATAEPPSETTAAPTIPATIPPSQAQLTTTRSTPVVATPSTTHGAATPPIPAAPALNEATPAPTATPTRAETRIVPSPAATFWATSSPMHVAAAAGAARPTSAPILAGGGAAQVSEALVPGVPQEVSRSIALGSGLALVVAAAVVGIVALVVGRRIR